MVIGEKSTGKKTLINMLFRRNQQLKEENPSNFTKGLRYFFEFKKNIYFLLKVKILVLI